MKVTPRVPALAGTSPLGIRPFKRSFTPDPDALYFTDNGCILCGEHLGASAKYTGRDISGQKIQRVSLADVRESRILYPDCPDLRCESCHKGFVGAGR